ncbi:MAG: glycosyltransferase [Patescibacteria group bacterium]|nr:glycosyltransferase [Patescibacteria group bacterium]
MKYFSYKQYNLKDLITYKEKNKLSVGLCLPIYNEAATIAKTIQVVKRCDNLIDEIIAIDSGSSDGSIEICKKFNINTITDKQSAKEINVSLQSGKGWNLWASLYYLNTDIIFWIDTDIQNVGEQFITGVVGPMIMDNKINFVKGYYHRPKNDARVTEIMVRPFINLIFPELIDFIQPLSGEYGGRKKYLEKIDFYSGYSVEMAVLLQSVFKLKSSEIAQVYLGKRIHALQSVISLGKMSSNILHTLLRIANDNKRLKIDTNKLPDTLINFISENGTDFISKKQKIADKKLPPMIKIKTYGK